jgi:hypothetical protein
MNAMEARSPMLHRPKLPFQLLHPTQCYADTVVLFLPVQALPDGIIERLRMVNDGAVFPQRRGTRQDHWGWKIVVHQPSRLAVSLLDRWQQAYEGKVIRLDLAIDLYPDAVLACRDWLHHGVTLKHRKSGPMFEFKKTTYWVDYRGCRAPTRNIGLYCDRPSKLNGRPCVHLEVKLTRGRTIRRLGIHRVKDVLTVNPAELLPRSIKLVEPAQERNRFRRFPRVPAQEMTHGRYRKMEFKFKPINLGVLELPTSLSLVPEKID